MTQFTVYRNKNPRSRTAFPFLVNVQSDLLDELQTQGRDTAYQGSRAHKKARGPFDAYGAVRRRGLRLMTPQLAGIARSELGPPAGNLAGRRDTIVAAMDFLLSGF